MTDNQHPDIITVTYGMSGFFAVHLSWTQEPDYGFYEPWTTGFGRYNTGAEANVEAKQWAEAEGIQYQPALEDSTHEIEAEKSRQFTERLKAKKARIEELKAQGLDSRSAVLKAHEEFKQ